jgi:hypothetical protein
MTALWDLLRRVLVFEKVLSIFCFTPKLVLVDRVLVSMKSASGFCAPSRCFRSVSCCICKLSKL